MRKKISILILICFCITIIGSELVFALEMQRQKQNVVVLNLAAMDELSQAEANLYTKRIIREFGELPQYNSMAQTNIANGLRQSNINPSDCYTTDCAVRAGRALGADFVAVGSLSKIGSIFTIKINMVSVNLGEVVNSVQEEYSGSEVQFLDYLSELTSKLVTNQPVQTVETQEPEVKETQPPPEEQNTIDTLLENPPATEEIKRPVQQPTDEPVQTQQIKKKGGSKIKYLGLVLLAGAGAALYFLKFKDNGSETTTEEPITTSPLPSPPAFPKK